MGGHAFKHLYCPRISPELYLKAKQQTTESLRKIFKFVVVPSEMPSKTDYGDIDFLAAAPYHTLPNAPFDWTGTVARAKAALKTPFGRQGFKNPDCLYFAIPAPGREEEFWIQVDVKVCEKPEMFEWETFRFNYASNSKMIGSIIKPLGLTIDPEGLHVRVEDIEENNLPGSMVWMSKDPRDVLKIVGLDRRILNGGFRSNDEIYEYFASSWVFNPAHFAARLNQEGYYNHLEDRSPHWIYFIKKWVPEHYPSYTFPEQDLPSEQDLDQDVLNSTDLKRWYKRMRAVVREKVFTMFPHITPEYYTKRATHLKEVEEKRLRNLIMSAIPIGENGWTDDIARPHIIAKGSSLSVPSTEDESHDRLVLTSLPTTPIDEVFESHCASSSPPSSVDSDLVNISSLSIGSQSPHSTSLFLEPLPREPPAPCTPHPPPSTMSLDAKLTCIARWTSFDPESDTPSLLREPRNKKFDSNNSWYWVDTGVSEKVLERWATEMWWHIWVRQSYVNYVGMWKKRFEKEDAKIAKEKAKADAEAEVRTKKEKVLKRLEAMNEGLGLVASVSTE